MATIDELRVRAETTQGALARLADALGTLEAEERQLGAAISADGLRMEPLELATKQARLHQLQQVIAAQRPIVERARADASASANTLGQAQMQLRQAEDWRARLVSPCRDDGPIAVLLAPWWLQLEQAEQIIARLTGQTPPELPTRPPLPEVELV